MEGKIEMRMANKEALTAHLGSDDGVCAPTREAAVAAARTASFRARIVSRED